MYELYTEKYKTSETEIFYLPKLELTIVNSRLYYDITKNNLFFYMIKDEGFDHRTIWEEHH